MLGLLGLGGAELVLGSSSEAGAAPAGRRKEMSLSTRLTREYGVRYPFVGAGMGFVGMPDLVAAVSNAGESAFSGTPPSRQRARSSSS